MKSNIPELRFKEYKEEWEKMKLRNLTERVRGNDGRMDLPTLTISAAYGWLDQRDRFSGNIAGNEQKNYTLLKKGELSYNHGNSKLAKYGAVFVLKTFKEALVPRIYHSFKTTNEASPYFIEAMFATKKPDRELGKLISSGARMDGLLNINYEDFVGIDITVPKIDEQNKIGDFILSLDSTINLSRQELEALKQTKQGFLQKMFPNNGESVPEIRFPGFDDTWLTKELIDIVTEISTGKSKFIKGNSEGDYTILGSTGIIGCDDSYDYEGDFLLTARVGVNAGQLYEYSGKVKITDNTVFIKGDNLSFIHPLLEFFDLKKLSFGSGQPLIKSSELKKLKVRVPSLKEQLKIGEFFRQLDEVIELKEKEIEALKETKKGFLQKMFV